MFEGNHRLPSRELLIIALLVLVTCAVYWPVRHYDFVNHDDPVYVMRARKCSGV